MDIILVTLFMLVIWVGVGIWVGFYGPTILKRQRMSWKEVLWLQSCMFPFFFLEGDALIALLFGDFSSSSRKSTIGILVAILAVHWFVIQYLLKSTTQATLRLWGVYLLAALLMTCVVSSIKVSTEMAFQRRVHGDLASMEVSLQDYQYLKKAYPIPEGPGGEPIAGVVRSETDSTVLYYVGPSFLPSAMIEADVITYLPIDPFSGVERGHETYGYGVGPISGASAVFVLSSRGPDRVSQAEEIEELLLRKWGGTLPKPGDLDDLTYSPTNGFRSSGDIYQYFRARDNVE